MPFNDAQPAYQRLRTAYAETRRPFVFWIGAGLSQPANLPSWTQLRSTLIAQALETLTTLEKEEADRREDVLTRAGSTDDLWLAFELIKKTMGATEFNAAVRAIFGQADNLPIPHLYDEIWSLRGVVGVLTLNIDGFVARSHRQARPSQHAATFVGRDAGDYAHLVSGQKPFIANLHGVHEAASSWVFTRSEVRHLFKRPAYQGFLAAVFSNATNVFVGISADDVAAGGTLQQLTSEGLDLGEHFWITSRRDAKTDQWGNKAGLQLIRYEAERSDEHTEVLGGIFSDLKSFVSTDAPAPVVVPAVPARETLPSPDQLQLMGINDLRVSLTARARSVIEASGGTTDSPQYRELINNYAPQVHMAWYVTDKPPHNKFQQYTVVEKVSTSPFSSVWRLYDEGSGEFYALKVIQIENLDKGAEIDSFRRGVQSLRYLTQAEVPGTAKIRDAYEIPTSVVMDFVDGEDLASIVAAGKLSFWADGIKILQNICTHLEFAHNLPQGVLHRDVRPSNIMMPYHYWTDSDVEAAGASRHDVILLNYDLSWHANASGRTISGNLAEAGYYAPEQLEDIEGVQARSTLVDSYGLGMTIFHCYSRTMPPPGGSRSRDWQKVLEERFRVDPALKWRSAPERLKRLVFNATRDRCEERWPIAAIRAELARLMAATQMRTDELTADVWAEELMSRVVQSPYEAASDGASFSQSLKVGRSVEVVGDLTSNAVLVNFRNMDSGSADWSSAGKRWRSKLHSAKDILVSGKWSILPETRAGHLDLRLSASLSVAELSKNIDRAERTLGAALQQVRLD